MLLITRKVNEEIIIDNGQILIKILFVQKGIIGLGIHAPSQVDVLRKEVFLKKLENAR